MMNMQLTQTMREENSCYRLLCDCPDPAMDVVTRHVKRGSRAESVLICGETGTGKEVVAKALHELGRRSKGKLVVEDCTNFIPELAASELFGHEPGAFTGAKGRRIGRCEQADGGTLFLDEIGELPLEIQPRLLRVLDSKTLTRVGGDEHISTSFNIIAATHRNLETMIAEGKFRQDLYYRLNTITIRVPPLRVRKKDILHFAHLFLSLAGAEDETRRDLSLSPEAETCLYCYAWPGNVRELRNVIDHAILMLDEDKKVIDRHHLPPLEKTVFTSLEESSTFFDNIAELVEPVVALGGLEKVNAGIQRALVERYLRNDKTLAQIAEFLRIDQSTLYRARKTWQQDDQLARTVKAE